MTCVRIPNGIMCTQEKFKPGDQAPSGYLAWHEWAEVQHKAGLRQVECGRCCKWQYPQELSDVMDKFIVTNRYGEKITKAGHVCIKCLAAQEKK